MEDEVNFLPEIDTKVFYKLKASLSVCVGTNSQSTQNNKFIISLHYLKENAKDEVDFLPAGKHQRLFQMDTIILGVSGQTCPNYTK